MRGTGHALERGQRGRRELGIVDGDGVVLVDAYRAAGARSLGDRLRRLLHAHMDVVSHLFVEGADGAAHLHRVGNDVLAQAALDDADGDHRRLAGDVDLPAHDGLQTEHHLRRGDDRIDAAPRHRAMRLPALDGDAKVVGAGHRGARAVADQAGGQGRSDVQAEDRIGRRVLERALLDHELRAAFFAFGRQLLGRLEDELHAARELLAQAGQHRGHRHQDGDVTVVPAGMHHAHGLAVPFGLDLRGEGHVDALLHGQAVHVGPQRNHGAGQLALQQADDTGHRNLGAHVVEAERAQVRGDDAGGAELAVAELGVRVQVTAPLDHAWLESGGGGIDGRVQRAGDGGGCGHGRSSGRSWRDCRRARSRDSGTVAAPRGARWGRTTAVSSPRSRPSHRRARSNARAAAARSCRSAADG